MKANIYSKDGKIAGKLDLPKAFETPVRLELIKRAVLSDMSFQYQPKGPDPRAGLKTSAKYRGRKDDYGSSKNHGIAMLPREIRPKGEFGKVRKIPSAVSGRRAHPPKPEKKLIEIMNKKEYLLALKSAFAATIDVELVKKRGHVFSAKELPIILDESCSSISKTKEVADLFKTIGIYEDIERAKQKRKARSGKRAYGTRTPKSILLITGSEEPIMFASENLAGVDSIPVYELTAYDLAPGTYPGRLCVFTKQAIEQIANLG